MTLEQYQRAGDQRFDYRAVCIHNKTETTAQFDNYPEAKEWVCIRLDNAGTEKIQVKIIRGGFAVVWSEPKIVETGAAKRAFDNSLSQQCVAIVH